MDKYLHVACLIPDSRVYDVLRFLEQCKAGNVEVRPFVPPDSNQLLLPPPTTTRAKRSGPPGGWRARTMETLKPGEIIDAQTLATRLGAARPNMNSVLFNLMGDGLLVRVSPGKYQLAAAGEAKTDQPPEAAAPSGAFVLPAHVRPGSQSEFILKELSKNGPATRLELQKRLRKVKNGKNVDSVLTRLRGAKLITTDPDTHQIHLANGQ